jgi:hypothetical protein
MMIYTLPFGTHPELVSFVMDCYYLLHRYRSKVHEANEKWFRQRRVAGVIFTIDCAVGGPYANKSPSKPQELSRLINVLDRRREQNAVLGAVDVEIISSLNVWFEILEDSITLLDGVLNTLWERYPA